jgi:tetratricopeptide (TPR) repeat protein
MGTRLGKYELGQELGRGGFGTIHIARDHELGRDVAIKLLKREHAFKEHVVQRFLQEARAAARINHPGIVTVFESGIAPGGDVYMAMELLAGETLSQRLKRTGPLPPAMAIELARQMASALAAAHDAGIIHRDLKPANVFLVRDPVVTGGERVKVLDFGIAKLVDDFGSNMQTHSMVMLGTPMYMSPEQCKSSAKVDVRSDVYALGCMLFEMLVGKTPFDGDSGELIAKHQLVPPPTVRSNAPHVPETLSLLVASMLAKSPNDRPPTMHAVVDTLDAIQSVAEPATTIAGESQPAPPLRRRTIVLGAGAAVALGVVVALAATRHHGGPAHSIDAPSHAIDAAAVAIVPVDAAIATPLDAVVALDAACDLDALRARGETATQKHQWAGALAAYEEALRCAPDDGGFEALALEASCRLASLPSARAHYANVPADKRDALAQICERNGIRTDQLEPPQTPRPAPAASCDAKALEEKGVAATGAGQAALALSRYEAALQCKGANEPRLHKLAFMAACQLKTLDKARLHWAQLSDTEKPMLVQMCKRNGITQAELDGGKPCNSKQLEDQAVTAEGGGKHQIALAGYEKAMTCANANMPRLNKLAFMAACEVENVEKARTYWQKLTYGEQATLLQMCLRAGITRADLDE